MHLTRHRCRLTCRAVLVLLGGICLSLAATAEPAAPSPFEARYVVRTSGIQVGTMLRRFTLAPDGTYRFESVVESTGLAAMLKPLRIEESSAGQWQADGPRPEHYAYRRVSGRKTKQTLIDFDWTGGRTRARIGDTVAESGLEPGTVDKLAYQLALMLDLAAGRQELAYRVADVGKLKDYTLVRGTISRVEAAGKSFETVPVEYARDDGRRTVLWCAPALGFLPVRIEYTEKDGALTTATLTRAP